MKKPKVTIYTDGSCSNEIGGWAAVIFVDGIRYSICGTEYPTTISRMEMTAVYKALEKLHVSCDVQIFADSQIVVNGITEWINKWSRTGWVSSSGAPVKNKDLWLSIKYLVDKHRVRVTWVKAHNNDTNNELVDKIANSARLQAELSMKEPTVNKRALVPLSPTDPLPLMTA